MMAWVSVHAYDDGPLDDLVPVATAAAARIDPAGWHYLRYWNGGPHLRIRVGVPETTRSSTVAELVGVLRPWLSARSAPVVAGPDPYGARARHWSGLEGVEPVPRKAAGTVEPTPYVPDDLYGPGSYGSPGALHHHVSSRIAAQAVRDGWTLDQRGSLAAQVLARTLTDAATDAPQRAAALLAGDALAGARWSAWRERYDARTGDAAALLVGNDAAIAGWLRSLHAVRGAVARQPAAGTDRPPPYGGVFELVVPPGSCGGMLAHAYHLLCNRLGLSPVAEGYLALVALQAVAGRSVAGVP